MSKKNKNEAILTSLLVGAPLLASTTLLGAYLSSRAKLTEKDLDKKTVPELEKINEKLINDLVKCNQVLKFKNKTEMFKLENLRSMLQEKHEEANKKILQKGGVSFPLFNNKKNLIGTILGHQEELFKCQNELKQVEKKYKNTGNVLKKNIQLFKKHF